MARAQRAVADHNVEKEILGEIEGCAKELGGLGKKTEGIWGAMGVLGTKEGLLERVRGVDGKERELSPALCLEKRVLGRVVDISGSKVMEGVFDIDKVMEKKLV